MDSKRKYDVLVCGYLCVDLVPLFKDNTSDGSTEKVDSLSPGTLTEIDGMTFTLGGAVGNTGMVLQKFKKKVFINGLVGDDHLGSFIMTELAKYQVANCIVKSTEAGTAFGIVLAPPYTDRLFLEYPGCSQFFDLASVAMEQVGTSSILHFGYAPLLKRFFERDGVLLKELLEYATQQGTVTSMDLSLPDAEGDGSAVDWGVVMNHALPYTDILLPSVEELLYMMAPEVYRELSDTHGTHRVLDYVLLETVRDLGQTLLKHGVKIIMIKMAHRGVYLVTGDISTDGETGILGLDTEVWNHQELLCEAYPLDDDRVTNASGAGDTAAAAFLAAIIEGESPERALKLSAMAGRESLYCDDLYSDLTTWDELAKMVDLETVNVRSGNDIITKK